MVVIGFLNIVHFFWFGLDYAVPALRIGVTTFRDSATGAWALASAMFFVGKLFPQGNSIIPDLTWPDKKTCLSGNLGKWDCLRIHFILRDNAVFSHQIPFKGSSEGAGG